MDEIYMKNPLLKLLVWAILILQLGACQKEPSGMLTEEDIAEIEQIQKDYTEGWIENDPDKILDLYTDSAIIIPSGLTPSTGKEAISSFWFPDDNSTTIVHSYDLEILDVEGSGNIAHTYEHGKLSFTYINDSLRIDRDSESYAITTFRKNSTGKWKITKRIWSDIR